MKFWTRGYLLPKFGDNLIIGMLSILLGPGPGRPGPGPSHLLADSNRKHIKGDWLSTIKTIKTIVTKFIPFMPIILTKIVSFITKIDSFLTKSVRNIIAGLKNVIYKIRQLLKNSSRKVHIMKTDWTILLVIMGLISFIYGVKFGVKQYIVWKDGKKITPPAPPAPPTSPTPPTPPAPTPTPTPTEEKEILIQAPVPTPTEEVISFIYGVKFGVKQYIVWKNGKKITPPAPPAPPTSPTPPTPPAPALTEEEQLVLAELKREQERKLELEQKKRLDFLQQETLRKSLQKQFDSLDGHLKYLVLCDMRIKFHNNNAITFSVILDRCRPEELLAFNENFALLLKNLAEMRLVHQRTVEQIRKIDFYSKDEVAAVLAHSNEISEVYDRVALVGTDICYDAIVKHLNLGSIPKEKDTLLSRLWGVDKDTLLSIQKEVDLKYVNPEFRAS